MNRKGWQRACAAFVITAAILFVFLCARHVTTFYYDAMHYWEYSEAFIRNGRLTFPVDQLYLRSYAWPLILCFLNGGGKFPFPVYWLLLSMFYALFIAVVSPGLFEELLGRPIRVIPRIIPAVLILVFWPGFVTYPLSDLAAPFFGVAAVWLIVLLNKTDSKLKFILYAFLAGVLADTALNIRSVFKYNIYLGAVLIIIFCLKNGESSLRDRVVKALKRMIPALLAFAVGVLAAAAPQIYANKVNYDEMSIDNPLAWYYETNGGYRSWPRYLIYEGLVMPRYETYVGDDPNIADAYTTYDPIMTEIFRREGIVLGPDSELSIRGYLRICKRYPLEVMCAFATHLFNNLDARYGNSYITEFGGTTGKQIISIAVYTLALIGVYLVSKRVKRTPSGVFPYVRTAFSTKVLVALYIAFPTLVAFPGHCDPRHSLSAQILMYFFLAYALPVKEAAAWIKKHWLAVIVAYALFFATATAIQNYSLRFAGDLGLLF